MGFSNEYSGQTEPLNPGQTEHLATVNKSRVFCHFNVLPCICSR